MLLGTSKGKGFQGVVKRHGILKVKMQLTVTQFLTVLQVQQDNVNFQVVYSRERKWLARWVLQVTTQNLEVVDADAVRGLIMIKGAVPGSKGGNIIVRPAVKA